MINENYPTIPIGKAKDLRGLKQGRLFVLDRAPNQINRSGAFWWCQCSCGNIIKVRGDQLTSKKIVSCGCYATEKAIETGKALAKKYNSINGKNNKKDLTSKRFNHLMVLEDSGKRIKIGNGTSVIWKCLCDCGNICEVFSGHLISGHTGSCGCNKRSRGEEKIKNILQENNIPFIEEYIVKDCKLSTGGNPRFDFYVNNLYYIEYDGIQHFDCENHGWNNLESFNQTKIRDLEKDKWCFDNNIPLIRIPYTHLKDISLEDLSIQTSKFIVSKEISNE